MLLENPIHQLTIAAMATALRNMVGIMDKAERHSRRRKLWD